MSYRSAVLAAILSFIAPLCIGEPITPRPWQEAVVSVTDLDRTAAFFKQIGNYKEHWRGQLSPALLRSWGLPSNASGEGLLLSPNAPSDGGMLRLVRFDNAGRKQPTRPGSRAWDTGCYFSVMVRAKDMQSLYDDAIALGWWTETPITYLEFGESKLNVVIFKGPDGVQVQAYERLSPALPNAIPAFERITRPFNMMQMVRNRDAAYAFYTDGLGFDTFYNGKPYVAIEPEYMPLGIPYSLTTDVPYRAGITYPIAGEFGRMEMIEIMGLEGRDYADQCHAPNLGILAVRFEVEDLKAARAHLDATNIRYEQSEAVALPPYGLIEILSTKTPDGAIIQFYAKAIDRR